MKRASLSLLLLSSTVFTAPVAFAKKIPFYIGTGSVDGIQQSTLDTETGAITAPKQVAKITKPSSLAISPDRKLLFSISSYRSPETNKGWNVAHSYRIEKNHSLTHVSENKTGSNGACHLFAHQDGKKLFIAHYGTAEVSSLKVGEDGSLSEPISVIKNSGSSIHPKRQQKATGHSVYSSPDGKFVYSADLGTDEVLIYALNQETAEIKRISQARVPAGSGPRHMAFNKDGSILYVLNELSLTISKFTRNASDGSLTLLKTKLITNEEVSGDFTCSEIHLSEDQKFLYAAKRDLKNTGKDSICLLDPETLQIIQEHPAEVWIPRHFDISPSGKWLIVAGQRGNKIAVHQRNPKTGKLAKTQNSIDLELPMWILFP